MHPSCLAVIAPGCWSSVFILQQSWDTAVGVCLTVADVFIAVGKKSAFLIPICDLCCVVFTVERQNGREPIQILHPMIVRRPRTIAAQSSVAQGQGQAPGPVPQVPQAQDWTWLLGRWRSACRCVLTDREQRSEEYSKKFGKSSMIGLYERRFGSRRSRLC